MTNHKHAGESAKTTKKVDFGFADNKGRSLGAEVITLEMYTVAPTDAEVAAYIADAESKLRPEYHPAKWWPRYDMPVGTIYVANVMATRNGVTFGASQRSSYFPTIEARDAWIAKRVDATRKRYAKQFAK